jgi:hypothetical protein
MARLVIDLPENSPGCILFSLFSGPGARLPASVGLGAAAGPRPIRPKRVRTRVGTPRKHAGRRLQGNINPLHANVRTSATTRERRIA